jgi:hypothetical protein
MSSLYYLVQKAHEVVVGPAGLVEIVGLQQHLRELLTTDIPVNNIRIVLKLTVML